MGAGRVIAHGAMWRWVAVACAVAARVLWLKRRGSENVDVGLRKTATVHRELPSLTGREG